MQRLEVVGKFFLAFASSIFFLMSGIVVPPIGMALIPLLPQPVLSFGFKYGARWAVAGSIGTTALLLVLGGKELAFVYGLFALMIALLFALLGRLRSIEGLVTGVAAAVFTVAAGVLFSYFGSWSALADGFRGNLLQHFTDAARLYEKMGFPQESLDLLQQRTPQIVEMMLQVLPGLVFVAIGLVVLVNVLVLCRRFPDRRPQWISVPNLREWNVPERMVWVLIVCGFALFVPGLEPLQVFGTNVLLVIAAFYFAQGLSIIAYFFHKNHVPRFLRAVTYVLIVFEQIFTLLVVGLGLFDLWGDFRRLKKDHLNPSQVS